MTEKLLATRKRRALLFLVMVLSFVLTAACLAAPSLRRSTAISREGQLMTGSFENFALAVSYYRGDAAESLVRNPQDTDSYKEFSDLLAVLVRENGLGRSYLLYRGIDRNYYFLADSQYRDNGTPGQDYGQLGGEYIGEVYTRRCRSALDDVFDGQGPATVRELIGGNTVVTYLPITNSSGEVAAALGCDMPLTALAFHQVGGVSLYVLAAVFAVLFLLSGGLWVLYRREREKRRAAAFGSFEELPPASEEQPPAGDGE